LHLALSALSGYLQLLHLLAQLFLSKLLLDIEAGKEIPYFSMGQGLWLASDKHPLTHRFYNVSKEFSLRTELIRKESDFRDPIEDRQWIRWYRTMREATKEVLCIRGRAPPPFCHKPILGAVLKAVIADRQIHIREHGGNNLPKGPSAVVTLRFPLLHQ